jgi:hypothetical protein
MAQQTQGISDQAVHAATGKTMPEWIKLLDAAGAKEKSHTEIARWLYDEGHITEGWWGQMVTVQYEQAIGRRVEGQNCYGEFVVNASKTLAGTMDSVLEAWQRRVQGMMEFNGTKAAADPTTSSTEKWRYWRVALEDGSKVSVNINTKPDGKILLGLEHRNVAGPEAREAWKAYWKEVLSTVP